MYYIPIDHGNQEKYAFGDFYWVVIGDTVTQKHLFTPAASQDEFFFKGN